MAAPKPEEKSTDSQSGNSGNTASKPITASPPKSTTASPPKSSTASPPTSTKEFNATEAAENYHAAVDAGKTAIGVMDITKFVEFGPACIEIQKKKDAALKGKPKDDKKQIEL